MTTKLKRAPVPATGAKTVTALAQLHQTRDGGLFLMFQPDGEKIVRSFKLCASKWRAEDIALCSDIFSIEMAEPRLTRGTHRRAA